MEKFSEISDFDKWVLATYKYITGRGFKIPPMREIKFYMVYTYEKECYDWIYGEALQTQNTETNIFASLQSQKLIFSDGGSIYNPVQGALFSQNIMKGNYNDINEIRSSDETE